MEDMDEYNRCLEIIGITNHIEAEVADEEISPLRSKINENNDYNMSRREQ